jgi:pilus assembly protein Flp/PilA
MEMVKSFLREEEGQDVVEYGLVVGLVSLIAFLGANTLGGQIAGLFGGIGTFVESATTEIGALSLS